MPKEGFSFAGKELVTEREVLKLLGSSSEGDHLLCMSGSEQSLTMKTISIDDDFYKFVQERATPYEEATVLDTIKRLVGFKATHAPFSEPRRIRSRSKRDKTDLSELVENGILQEGQALVFTDYQGNRYPEHKVILSRGRLIYQDCDYSMSDLASILLKGLGFRSSAVRGPQFWSTGSGDLVMEVWNKYLDEHPDRIKLL